MRGKNVSWACQIVLVADFYGLFGSLLRKKSRGEESSEEESRKEQLSFTLFWCF